jgi:hypothetical protein
MAKWFSQKRFISKDCGEGMKAENPRRTACLGQLGLRGRLQNSQKKKRTTIVSQHQTASRDGGHFITSLWHK